MAIVVRSDLKMSPGLLSAQVLHAGMEFIRQKAIIQSEEEARTDRALKFEAVEEEWITSPYVSVLSVGTREELEHIRKQAKDAGLKTHEWIDTIPSPVIPGFTPKCMVGISIGPHDADDIKRVCGALPLY